MKRCLSNNENLILLTHVLTLPQTPHARQEPRIADALFGFMGEKDVLLMRIIETSALFFVVWPRWRYRFFL